MWPKPKQSRRQVVTLVLGGASPPGHPNRSAPGVETSFNHNGVRHHAARLPAGPVRGGEWSNGEDGRL